MNRDDATDGRWVSRVGGVVVLHGAALRAALDAVAIATRTRRTSGWPISRTHHALALALVQAVAVSGQTDVREDYSAMSALGRCPDLPSFRSRVTRRDFAAGLGKGRTSVRVPVMRAALRFVVRQIRPVI